MLKVFKAHSTRFAITSHAYRAGVPLADILNTGDRASAATFQWFLQPAGGKHQFILSGRIGRCLEICICSWTFLELEVRRRIIINYARGTYLDG